MNLWPVLISTVAALNVQASFKAADVVTNEYSTPFVVTVHNLEADPVNLTGLAVSLRAPGKDFRKTYANYTQSVSEVVAPGAIVELPFVRTFSVPTKKYDVLFNVFANNEVVVSPISTVQFKDPELSYTSPQFGLAMLTCIGMVGGFVFLVLSIARPDLLDEYLFKHLEKPKQKKEAKRVERSQTPEEPDAWLPEKHKKKAHK